MEDLPKNGKIVSANGRNYWIGWDGYTTKKGEYRRELRVTEAQPSKMDPEDGGRVLSWRPSYQGARIGSTVAAEMVAMARAIIALSSPPIDAAQQMVDRAENPTA